MSSQRVRVEARKVSDNSLVRFWEFALLVDGTTYTAMTADQKSNAVTSNLAATGTPFVNDCVALDGVSSGDIVLSTVAV